MRYVPLIDLRPSALPGACACFDAYLKCASSSDHHTRVFRRVFTNVTPVYGRQTRTLTLYILMYLPPIAHKRIRIHAIYYINKHTVLFMRENSSLFQVKIKLMCALSRYGKSERCKSLLPEFNYLLFCVNAGDIHMQIA